MPAQLPPDPDGQPMGATVSSDDSGVVSRCWAPRAENVWVAGDFNGWQMGEAARLNRRGGFWVGLFPGVGAGARYKFRVEGALPEIGWKRDPYARELTKEPPHPRSECVVADPADYPWRDGGYLPPRVHDLIVYQLHIGTFNAVGRANRAAKFLDVLGRLDYLVALGVNALLFLPIVEFMSERSLGYEGADIFSPEQDYCVGEVEAASYLPLVNGLRARAGLGPVDAEFLASHSNQLKVVIELCHRRGVAVLFDLVYNHVNKDVPGPDGVESIWTRISQITSMPLARIGRILS
jgi:1,4-alpha-glucan branching enzyme